jgi:hypothetical protein
LGHLFGLPVLRAFWSAFHPAYAQLSLQSFKDVNIQEHWLTKDAAGFFTFLLFIVGTLQVLLFL